MANVFVNIPLPAGDGVGAAVDVSNLGAERTFQVAGDYQGTVTFEGSNDAGGTWVPIIAFTRPAAKMTLVVAVEQLRVAISGSNGVLPTSCGVGSTDIGGGYVNLPATAGAGTAAPVDVSALGTVNTAIVTGTFGGTVSLEISDDGIDYVECMSFSGVGYKTKVFTAQFMRVTRKNVPVIPGLPIINVGAINDATAGGGGGGSLVVQEDGTTVVAAATTLDFQGLPISEPVAGTARVTEFVRGVASNNALINAAEIVNIYVRPGGNDTTGDGTTPGTAYATIQRALRDIPPRFMDKSYVIECTGLGSVDFGGDDFSFFPSNAQGGLFAIDPSFGTGPVGFLGNVTLLAQPNVEFEIQQADVTGTSVNPYSGYTTLQTNLNLTLDQLKGRILFNAAGTRIQVIGNTAGPNSEIRTNGFIGNFDPADYPVQVLEMSCRLTNTPSVLAYGGGGLNFAFNGIGVDGFAFCIGNVSAFCCEFTAGAQFAATDSAGGPSDCTFQGGFFLVLEQGELQIGGCAFLNSAAFYTELSGSVRFFGCVFDGGRGIRWSKSTGGSDLPLAGSLTIEQGEISNADQFGLRLEGGHEYADVRNCDFANNDNGLQVLDGGFAVLSNCGSTTPNTSRGVVLEAGSQVQLAANTIDIQGTTADYKVGGNPDSAAAGAGWAAFAVDEQEHDLAADLPQLCRMFRTGATVDRLPLAAESNYFIAGLSIDTSVAEGSRVPFDNVSSQGTAITMGTNGLFSLTPNKTYEIHVSVDPIVNESMVYTRLYNATLNAPLVDDTGSESKIIGTGDAGSASDTGITGSAVAVFTPTVATDIEVRREAGTDSLLQEYRTGMRIYIRELDPTIAAGLNERSHRALDQLVHEIAETSFEEVTYNPDGTVANVIVWTDNLKTTRIRATNYTYTAGEVTQVETIQYDAGGNAVETLTETLTYVADNLDNIDRVLS